MRTTQRKGDIAVSKAISSFTALGADISIPLTKSAPYDLIADFSNKLYRIQIKYISGNEVDLRNIHSNSKGYVVKKTLEITYDWLYVYHASGKEFLVPDCLINRRSITFYNDTYLLKNVVENLK